VRGKKTRFLEADVEAKKLKIWGLGYNPNLHVHLSMAPNPNLSYLVSKDGLIAPLSSQDNFWKYQTLFVIKTFNCSFYQILNKIALKKVNNFQMIELS
jgi:hypothetical protein